ncbi:DUF1343 domain-containing protein [Lacticaseibacillus camelliae]|uniref:Uncharacterized protein n=1 Tax=Lacticaseibacillus camelliae DSM 22697 = JCM 13995 TaxID=1423730 RepID=A0A0R2F1P5_9LACO|nr:DUF1343 domain-containing protein [Lacticaseibacillus camelliae]KRN22521.1 hypothetical protein FC75_GL001800 [Lacticaseibacillus camelliae DSM 22697 = JCM 13995]
MANNGIDNSQMAEKTLKGQRIGLITNQTGVAKDFTPDAQVLNTLGKVVKLFCQGEATAPVSAVPVVNFTGANLPVGALADVDVLAYDIAATGVRFDASVALELAGMQAAAEADVPFVVFDRVLPLGRLDPEGTPMPAALASADGVAGLPILHSLTPGELARWANPQIDCDLRVVPVTGWDATGTVAENDLPWIAPKQFLPTLASVALLPGLGLLERLNVSVGRGTALPFQQFGAPWLNSQKLSEMLSQTLAGQSRQVHYRPTVFKPLAGQYQGEVCQGIQVHLQHLWQPQLLNVGLDILFALHALHPSELVVDAKRLAALTGEVDVFSQELSALKSANKKAGAKFAEASKAARLYQ